MRIIGGEFRGRRFNPPAKNWPTRPTTDFSKEGLFNILQNRIDFEETKMLDLFGGTGNHCYEFISRGIEDRITIVKSDVFKFIRTVQHKYDYIFAGPPYPLPILDSIPDEIFKYELLNEDGLFVLEHNPKHDFKKHERYVEERNYGTTIFSFFK